MPDYELSIQEAEVNDSYQLMNLLKKISQEASFITETENICLADSSDLTQFILRQNQALNSICLIAKLNEEIVGLLNVTAGSYSSNAHIGELFIAIEERFQGFGLGHELMTLALEWAEQTPELLKIELEVQSRNEVALHLYEFFGFIIEGKRKMGVKSKDGEFLDVYLMGKCLKEE